jgi:hypothetical protein
LLVLSHAGLYDHLFLFHDFGPSGKLLLALASTVVLGSESCRTHNHLLLFHDFGPSGKLLLGLTACLVPSPAGITTIFYWVMTLGVTWLYLYGLVLD